MSFSTAKESDTGTLFFSDFLLPIPPEGKSLSLTKGQEGDSGDVLISPFSFLRTHFPELILTPSSPEGTPLQ